MTRRTFIRLWLPLLIILSGCASVGLGLDSETLFGKTVITDNRSEFSSTAAVSYRSDIEPVLENRCVVCHACYDAPCQLKLTSPEGIMRGATPEKVYQGTRLLAAEPTRLGIDAQSTEEWRTRGFHSVLNERSRTGEINLANSLIYQMLALKKANPLPAEPLLNDDFDLSLNREQSCPTREEFSEFAEEHPLWGMPYGLPALNDREYQLLTGWLRDGAPMSADKPLTAAERAEVDLWERYFNDDSLKQQLASRYMYEHLFLANLYFSPEPLFRGIEPATRPTRFYHLVRSYTAPGLPIRIVATRRPYDDPGTERIYYRLQPVTETIVAKTHMPYRLNNERMEWMKNLFSKPDYEVTALPGYEPEVAANPFVAFHDLPVVSRYRFMLEESEFLISGFIKGPVCRGQVALNVIDDHFWAVFVDPDQTESTEYADFLSSQSNNLRLPGEAESNSGVLTNWLRYSNLHSNYIDARNQAMTQRFPDGQDLNLDLVWDGDGHNPNAALTIIRHFDSSTVVKGMVGQPTKTAWLVGYPLLERIHYLLVTEFDVFGNVGHQLMTRLYMDFLRMEGEHNFLTLLPQEERIKLAQFWYRDATDEVTDYLVNYEKQVLTNPTIDYQSDDPKTELYALLQKRLGKALDPKYQLSQSVTPELQGQLEKINSIKGRAATTMPEISFLMLEDMGGRQQVFTLLRASGHSNLTGLLYEDDNRLPEEDYLTVVPGILGSYPSTLFRLSSFRLDRFIDDVSQLDDEDDFRELSDRYAVRRTDPQFWTHSDQLHHWYSINDPLNFGILDYNRLDNR